MKDTELKPDLLKVIDAVAEEKKLNKDEIFQAVEEALRKAARSKYGMELDLEARIDRNTAEIQIYKCVTVVPEVFNVDTEINIEDALDDFPDCEVGTVLREALPPISLGRITAQVARQVIYSKVREAERLKLYEEFKNRIHTIVSGVVKRSDFTGVVVDLGKIEAVLRREEMIPRESFRNGDRIRAYVSDIRNDHHGVQIVLSRTHPQFLAKLFMQEVPEVYDGIIEIRNASRDPGSRAKVAVSTHDHNIDPVGSCVGVRGSRIQAIIDELQGEKIDVINWSANPATFIVNALSPAEIDRVVLDEERRKVEVIVPDTQLSIAIGRRGQNVRLASSLTGWQIEVMTAADADSRRADKCNKLSQHFIDALDVDSMIAHLLVNEGFENAQEIAEISIDELQSISGFDQEIAEELINRAISYVQELNDRFVKMCTENDVLDNYLEIVAKLDKTLIIKMLENGIKTIDDIGDLAADELVEILEGKIQESEASDMIMQARAHWFSSEESEKGN